MRLFCYFIRANLKDFHKAFRVIITKLNAFIPKVLDILVAKLSKVQIDFVSVLQDLKEPFSLLVSHTGNSMNTEHTVQAFSDTPLAG